MQSGRRLSEQSTERMARDIAPIAARILHAYHLGKVSTRENREMSDERKENFTPSGSPYADDQISLLEAFDRAVALLPPDNFGRERLVALRAEIAAQEEMVGDAREMIEKLEQVIKKVTSPANRIGTFLGSPARDTAQIVVGGADYYCNVDPRISLARLQKEMPDLAFRFHEGIAAMMAARLTSTNRLVSFLAD